MTAPRAGNPKPLSTTALCALGIVLAAGAPPAAAAISQTPLSVTQAVEPLVMFVMSNDHQLYYKAYADWNDLDGDGDPETTYKHSFDYYGYFDPDKCYDYDTSDNRFEPAAVSPDKYCDSVSGSWSGNFLNWASMARMDILRKVLYGGYRSTDSSSDTVLERTFLPTDAHSFAKYYAGPDIAKLTPFGSAPSVTLCNTTYATSGSSENAAEPPLLRVVQGDFRYWAANERWQCTWDDERRDATSGSNDTGSNTSDPDKASDGLGEKDYRVRVQVCVSGLIGSEECRQYPSGNYKPTGLLHDYGEEDTLKFGLMTGSYDKNKSGGVLRRNVGNFSSEVNANSDGTFTGVDGIVTTMDKLRIARYYYGSGNNDGLYNSTDSCSWGISSFTEGNCSNWGNPISEMYLEAVRYFAGLSATASFAATDSDYITNLTSENWSDPFTSDTWCARPNIILINASEVSYDDDTLDMSGLPGSPSASSLTNTVGDLEGISGNAFFVGENGTDNNQLCTAKTVAALGNVRGTCPGSPRLSGTYYASGISHWARTNDIRTDLQDDQIIITRAITLVGGVPRIQVPVPGSTGTVTILPACRNKYPNPDGNCAIVDFKIIAQDLQAGTGTFYVNWEDSEQGGDYDQDMKGTLSYAISTQDNSITITTDVNAKSTPHEMGFGYVISGTTLDGFHVHSGINGFDYTDPTGVTGCSDCVVGDSATSFTYSLGASSASLLEDPLWYAAKYGSFRDLNDNDRPDNNDPFVGDQEWDADGDGEPDGYFQVNNPAALGPALANVLTAVSGVSSSASVVANSITLQTGTYIYQARFYSDSWSGDLLALPLNSDGSIGMASWSARTQLDGQDWDTGREILTSTAAVAAGVPFRWDSLSAAQQTALQTHPDTGAVGDAAAGQARLEYLRGSDADELQNGGSLRDRESVLGDIVNSEPFYVGAPPYFYPDALEAAPYDTFASSKATRTGMLYAGANDGALHGFSAETGEELIAYVPRAVVANLPALTSIGYDDSHRFYVDGGPVAGDVYLPTAATWATVLVGGLGAGGAGIYALDVTDPVDFDEANAASLVLWDITSADTGYADLGHTFSKPAIVRLPDSDGGVWAAVFGNGYGGAAGSAVLYIADIEDGSLLYSVVADAGPGNGLSSVAPVDYDGDFKIDFIYAGDLKGNLWRFEPSGAGSWVVSFAGAALFTARDDAGSIQPITSRPEVGLHTLGGLQVFFGTGKYYETGDNNPNTGVTQSFYGIWDQLDGTSGITRAHLLEQQILGEASVNEYDTRWTSDNTATWHTGAGLPAGTPPTTHMGWYLDLLNPVGPTAEGEMQVTDAQLRGGRIIFTSMIPSAASCDFGGTGWLMELSAEDGGRPDEVIFDLNGDGLFDEADLVDTGADDDDGNPVMAIPTGKKSTAGVIQEPAIIAAGTKEYKYASGAKQAQIDVTTENPGEAAGGRQSWIELPSCP